MNDYELPTEQLIRRVQTLVEQAAPDRRLALLEMSEDRPGNWRQTVPVVLETLARLGTG